MIDTNPPNKIQDGPSICFNPLPRFRRNIGEGEKTTGQGGEQNGGGEGETRKKNTGGEQKTKHKDGHSASQISKAFSRHSSGAAPAAVAKRPVAVAV